MQTPPAIASNASNIRHSLHCALYIGDLDQRADLDRDAAQLRHDDALLIAASVRVGPGLTSATPG
jgi:hypothetical protein